ncbi:MAG: TolB family protein [Gemmatimonadaceae bacterium]
MERFAPGGREIAVSSARSDAGGIWIIDPDRAGSVRSIISALVSFFTWSPDGTHLVAESRDSLVLVAAEGGSAPVTIAGGSGEVPAQWLSGDTILTVASNKNVGEVPVAGGTPRVVLTEPGALGYPAVSPDGRWLVYTATEGNQENVVLRQWPSLAGRRVVSAGTQPAWARGGRELLFQAAGGHVMAVDVGPDGATGVPHEVLNQALPVTHPLRTWDVSSDGERFLDTVPDSAAFPPAPVIHVTLGWFRQIAGKGQ